jgi:hypothetical protein
VRVRVAPVGLLLILVAACSSFQGEAEPVGTPEAGPPGDDAGDAGGGDALVADALADAAVEASPDAGPRFCLTLKPAPVFCADFDDGNPLTTQFATVTGDLRISGEGALRADGRVGAPALVGRTLPDTRPVSQSLSFRVRAGNSSSYKATAARLVVTSSTNCNFEVRLTSTQAFLYMSVGGATAPPEQPILGHPGPDKWFEIRLELKAGTGGNATKVAVRAKIDGVDGLSPAEAVSPCLLTTLALTDALPRIELGAQSANDNSLLHFDNVVFDGK